MKVFLYLIIALSIPRVFAGPQVVVDSLEDDGVGSLRQALLDVDPGGTIVFEASLSGETITLVSDRLTIDKELVIDASDLDASVVISAGDLFQVIQFDEAAEASLRNITMSDARGGGGVSISAGAVVEFLDCTIINNDSGSSGGGIYIGNDASLEMARCLIQGNVADDGGGVYNRGFMRADGCTFRENESRDDGGGLYNHGTEYIESCLFVANLAGREGGGMWLRRDTDLQNCTIVENEALRGGGIYCTEKLDLYHCTIVGNSATYYYGAYLVSLRFRAWSTIVSDNRQGTEISGISAGHISGSVQSFFGDGAPLEVLGDYGGPTWTRRPSLGADSLIDQGEVSPDLLTDARGQPRVTGEASDIGAVEYLGTLEEELYVDPFGDYDGDGDANLFESVTARDPLVPDYATDKHLAMVRSDSGHAIQFGFDAGYAERVEIRLLASEGVGGLDVLLTDDMIKALPVEDERIIYELDLGARSTFYRLEIEEK